jgi:hypothetical protein
LKRRPFTATEHDSIEQFLAKLVSKIRYLLAKRWFRDRKTAGGGN